MTKEKKTTKESKGAEKPSSNKEKSYAKGEDKDYMDITKLKGMKMSELTKFRASASAASISSLRVCPFIAALRLLPGRRPVGAPDTRTSSPPPSRQSCC